MRILVSGSTGLIGSALVKSLIANEHQVTRLVRPGSAITAGEIMWQPAEGELDTERLEGFDAVVHLAGENIAGRWTEEKKRRIYESRVRGTDLLCRRLKVLEKPPKVAVFASAFGYYGDKGDDIITEDAEPGDTFLARVTRDWEAAADQLDETTIRRVHLRIGLVFSDAGGFLEPIVPIFKFFLGGKLGSGEQWMSWISRHDLVRVIQFAIDTEALSGPVNTVSPDPVTNKEFTRTLGRVLGRPTIFTVPGFALKLVAGDLGREMLASIRAVPKKLQDSGFTFDDVDMEATLEKLVG